MSTGITDEIMYWGLRGYSRFLKGLGDIYDRFWRARGAVGYAGVLTATIAGALIDRAFHPVDTYRFVRERQACHANR